MALPSPFSVHSTETKDNGEREEWKFWGEKRSKKKNISKPNQNTTKKENLTKPESFRKPKVCCRVILHRKGISAAMESIKNFH